METGGIIDFAEIWENFNMHHSLQGEQRPCFNAQVCIVIKFTQLRY